MALPGSISMLSYSPGSGPEIKTFLMLPSAVPKIITEFCHQQLKTIKLSNCSMLFFNRLPRNANVCGPVIAAVTEVIDAKSKSNKEYEMIGDTPLIFNPTLQKLCTFPVV